jgi:DUF4097 and DUF4098 domain-containing protein YvlB
MFTMGVLASVAFAEECARVELDGASLELGGATALVVQGIEGAIEVVGAEGGPVQATGTACRDDLQIKLSRKEGVVYAKVKGARDASLELTLVVPRSVAAVTAHENAGPLTVRDLPARVAVVSNIGPVAVSGASNLRVAYSTGPVDAAQIAGDLVVDRVTGPLSAAAIGGDVAVDGVTGPVTVDDVGGDLAVQGGTGTVNQSNVRGTVLMP